jgi:hypothetical protein
MPDRTSRDLTPADLRVLEPDLVGAIGFVLYGREASPPPQRSRRDRQRPRPDRPMDGPA